MTRTYIHHSFCVKVSGFLFSSSLWYALMSECLSTSLLLQLTVCSDVWMSQQIHSPPAYGMLWCLNVSADPFSSSLRYALMSECLSRSILLQLMVCYDAWMSQHFPSPPAYGVLWCLNVSALLFSSSLWCAMMPECLSTSLLLQLMVCSDAWMSQHFPSPPAYGVLWCLNVLALLFSSSLRYALMPECLSRSIFLQLMVRYDAWMSQHFYSPPAYGALWCLSLA